MSNQGQLFNWNSAFNNMNKPSIYYCITGKLLYEKYNQNLHRYAVKLVYNEHTNEYDVVHVTSPIEAVRIRAEGFYSPEEIERMIRNYLPART